MLTNKGLWKALRKFTCLSARIQKVILKIMYLYLLLRFLDVFEKALEVIKLLNQLA